MDDIQCSYLNMMLSFRGSERQPPNMLQMALRFSIIMEQHVASGKHAKDLNSEQQLRKVIAECEDLQHKFGLGVQCHWTVWS